MRRLLLLILLLLIPLVSAVTSESATLKVDFVFKPTLDSNITTLVMNPTAQNDSKGYLYIVPIAIIPPIGGGGSTGPIQQLIDTTDYYIIIKTAQPYYHTFQNVKINVTVIPKFNYNDYNGKLTTYLLGPTNEKLFIEQENYKIITPACSIGVYNLSINKCVYNGKEYNATTINLFKEYSVPWYFPLGQYTYTADFQSDKQTPIKVSLLFKYNLWWMLIIVFLVSYLLYRRHKKKKALLITQERIKRETEEDKIRREQQEAEKNQKV